MRWSGGQISLLLRSPSRRHGLRGAPLLLFLFLLFVNSQFLLSWALKLESCDGEECDKSTGQINKSSFSCSQEQSSCKAEDTDEFAQFFKSEINKSPSGKPQPSSPVPPISNIYNLQFPPPSTSTLTMQPHLITYEEPDEQSSLSVSAANFNWKDYEQRSMALNLMVAKQRSQLSNTGRIYRTIGVHRESIVKRLKDLCNEAPTIPVGIEMADAASLLKLMSFSTHELESAERQALTAAMLLYEAENLKKNGLKLLSESQKSLRDHTMQLLAAFAN